MSKTYDDLFTTMLDCPDVKIEAETISNLVYPVRKDFDDGPYTTLYVPTSTKVVDKEMINMINKHERGINKLNDNLKRDMIFNGRLITAGLGLHVDDVDILMRYQPRFSESVFYKNGKTFHMPLIDRFYSELDHFIIAEVIMNYERDADEINLIFRHQSLLKARLYVTFTIRNPENYYDMCISKFNDFMKAQFFGHYETAVHSDELAIYRNFYYDKVIKKPRMPMSVFIRDTKDFNLINDYPIISDAAINIAIYRLMKLMVKELCHNKDNFLGKLKSREIKDEQFDIALERSFRIMSRQDIKIENPIFVKGFFDNPLHDFYQHRIPVEYKEVKKAVFQDLHKNIKSIEDINDINYSKVGNIPLSARQSAYIIMRSRNDNIKINNMTLYYFTLYMIYYEKASNERLSRSKPQLYGEVLRLAKANSGRHRQLIDESLKTKFDYINYEDRHEMIADNFEEEFNMSLFETYASSGSNCYECVASDL